VTKTRAPSGEIVTVIGASPTLTLPVTFWLATSMTETLSEPPRPVLGPVLAT
jgi:hypothetical protein